MNEGMAIFLKLNVGECKENETLIRRMNDLLSNLGIAYTGVNNIYRPVEQKDRDHAVFAACRALRETDWLKDKLDNISIMNRVSTCSIDQIGLEHMSEPSTAKLEYYEDYYRKSRKLAHGVVIDEYGQLRDGYTSYIIAKKYGIRPDVYEALVQQPLRKIVRGRHVFRDGDTWKAGSRKIYAWNYTLKLPVVPGDILRAQTKKGSVFICVHEIDYITGEEFCKEHGNVLRHMRERLPG